MSKIKLEHPSLDIVGTEIIGKYATVFHNNQEIPILEAEFVEPSIGTGSIFKANS